MSGEVRCGLRVLRMRILGHSKERPKVVVEEAGPEVARLGETVEAISSHKKEQEGKVAITREEMHSRSELVNGNITYRC